MAAVAAGLSFLGTARADSGYPEGARGYDISYPQCSSTFPSGSFGFGIVGLNNGRPMTQNPCFAAQLAWARKGEFPPSIYVNTSSPPASYTAGGCAAGDAVCRSYQYGRDAARYVLDAGNRMAPDVSRYWLDVETANTWSSDKIANAAMLRGMIEGLSGAGKVLGIYSTSYQFGLIAGSFAPGLDTWVPRPEARRESAADYCRRTPSFGGGRLVMLQLWYTYDENYVCPAPAAAPPAPTPLKAGDTAIVAAGGECLNVRAGAGISFAVKKCVADGTRLDVTGAPVAAGAYNWVPVSGAGVTGWAASDYLRAATASPPQSAPGETNRVVIAHVSGD